MREFTNLAWPETPFGAEQRPFGRHIDMLAACTFEWTDEPETSETLPVAASLVYLRVRRRGSTQTVSDDTLSIGFRTAVIEDRAEVPDLLTVADRALTRARRHAVIMAGHWLRSDLDRINARTAVPLRGVDGVLSAWADRAEKQRGVAVMIDTGSEANKTGADLGMSLEPVPERVPDCPYCVAEVARRALARCLAVGMTAALHASRYTWEGKFCVSDAVEQAGWDVLSQPGGTCPAVTTGKGGAGQVADTAERQVARVAT
uniref:hypothetical protein n=1 Tax=Paractinoplanes polyasparticus TaxID=2856853 RepID=UPI001C8469A8|nr:hypothetical protein [Actinoplanes polyasparticus]